MVSYDNPHNVIKLISIQVLLILIAVTGLATEDASKHDYLQMIADVLRFENTNAAPSFTTVVGFCQGIDFLTTGRP